MRPRGGPPRARARGRRSEERRGSADAARGTGRRAVATDAVRSGRRPRAPPARRDGVGRAGVGRLAPPPPGRRGTGGAARGPRRRSPDGGGHTRRGAAARRAGTHAARSSAGRPRRRRRPPRRAAAGDPLPSRRVGPARPRARIPLPRLPRAARAQGGAPRRAPAPGGGRGTRDDRRRRPRRCGSPHLPDRGPAGAAPDARRLGGGGAGARRARAGGSTTRSGPASAGDGSTRSTASNSATRPSIRTTLSTVTCGSASPAGTPAARWPTRKRVRPPSPSYSMAVPPSGPGPTRGGSATGCTAGAGSARRVARVTRDAAAAGMSRTNSSRSESDSAGIRPTSVTSWRSSAAPSTQPR